MVLALLSIFISFFSLFNSDPCSPYLPLYLTHTPLLLSLAVSCTFCHFWIVLHPFVSHLITKSLPRILSSSQFGWQKAAVSDLSAGRSTGEEDPDLEHKWPSKCNIMQRFIIIFILKVKSLSCHVNCLAETSGCDELDEIVKVDKSQLMKDSCKACRHPAKLINSMS